MRCTCGSCLQQRERDGEAADYAKQCRQWFIALAIFGFGILLCFLLFLFD